MALSSKLFTGESPGKPFLQRCAETPAGRLFRGTPPNSGSRDAIARVQAALRLLGFAISDSSGVYGASTEAAVLKFKGPPRNILGPGQTRPDATVGIQTIHRLDEAISGSNQREREKLVFGSQNWRFTLAGDKGFAGKGAYDLVITSTNHPDSRIFRMNELSATGDLVGGFRGKTRGRFDTPFKWNAIDFHGTPSLLVLEKQGKILKGSLALSFPSKHSAMAFSFEPFEDERPLGGAFTSGSLNVTGQLLIDR